MNIHRLSLLAAVFPCLVCSMGQQNSTLADQFLQQTNCFDPVLTKSEGAYDPSADGFEQTIAFANADNLCQGNPACTLNIVTEFGANGLNIESDHKAFVYAANYINARSVAQPTWTTVLEIPEGEYIVGYQYQTSAPPMRSFTAENPFGLLSASNVEIIGLPGGSKPIIRFDACMRFGLFDPNPPHNKVVVPGNVTSFQSTNNDGFRLAEVGHMFLFDRCTNITIRDLELHGNSGAQLIGGRYGDHGIQADYDGISASGSVGVTVKDCDIHSFGRDGVVFYNRTFTGNSSLDALVENCNLNCNGRLGLTFGSGSYFTVKQCTVMFNGFGRVSSSPAAGIDLEYHDYYDITDGEFRDCFIAFNKRDGLISDDGNNKHVQDHEFHNCVFIGSDEGKAVHPNAAGMKFFGCDFHGAVQVLYSVPDGTSNNDFLNDRLEFKQCNFSDSFQGVAPSKELIGLSIQKASCLGGDHNSANQANGMLLEDCTFETAGGLHVFAIRGSQAFPIEVLDGLEITHRSTQDYFLKGRCVHCESDNQPIELFYDDTRNNSCNGVQILDALDQLEDIGATSGPYGQYANNVLFADIGTSLSATRNLAESALPGLADPSCAEDMIFYLNPDDVETEKLNYNATDNFNYLFEPPYYPGADCGNNCTMNDVTLTFHLEGGGKRLRWQLFQGNSSIHAEPWFCNTVSETKSFNLCLDDGCYRLEVWSDQSNHPCNDNAANGIPNGKYILSQSGGRPIIIADGGKGWSHSHISLNGGFCLPTADLDLGSSASRNVEADRVFTVRTSDGVLMDPCTAGSNPNAGYQFWIFDPHGTYSRRIKVTCSYAAARVYNLIAGQPPTERSDKHLRIMPAGLGISSGGGVPIPWEKPLNIRVRWRDGSNIFLHPDKGFGPAREVVFKCKGTNRTQLVEPLSCSSFPYYGSCASVNSHPALISCDPQANGSSMSAFALLGSYDHNASYDIQKADNYEFTFDDGMGNVFVEDVTTSLLPNIPNREITTATSLPSGTYTGWVKVSYNNGASYCPEGPSCSITVQNVNNNNKSLEGSAGHIELFPNPTDGSTDLNISVADLGSGELTVEVLDVLGKRLLSEQVQVKAGDQLIRLEQPPGIAPGVYSVVLTQGDERYVTQYVID